ncbi:hypothetical protein HYFRA_00004163 [Hymenoscyphus fraxineus]|uniref:Uncharacterized protein n=1 Tax=Hymenoscyphus fraxineus TaxID=746836 RepID=A0A9N9PPV7_9HELO|nr:hypothetical protein HYFRA_00004163 [Hymenoscyphus fraxineus]
MPPNPYPIKASAKMGRNQHTGSRNLPTPPENKSPFDSTLQGTKRKNEHDDHHETRLKAHVLAIVEWEDSKPFQERAKREDIFKFCGVSERRGYAIIEGYNKGRKEGERPGSDRTFHDDTREEET